MKKEKLANVHAKWVKRWLKAEDLECIENAVKQAELSTSAEIVPMVVSASSPVGHVPYVLFLAALTLLWSLLPYLAPLMPHVPFEALELAGLVAAAVLTLSLRRNEFILRVLTPRHDRAMSALRRAQLEFYQSNIKATESKTGVLIFVSLLERQAVVLADKAIAEKFPSETWTKILGELINRVKEGHLSDGLCSAVAQTGELLKVPFPVTPQDLNELPDQLVIKD